MRSPRPAGPPRPRQGSRCCKPGLPKGILVLVMACLVSMLLWYPPGRSATMGASHALAASRRLGLQQGGSGQSAADSDGALLAEGAAAASSGGGGDGDTLDGGQEGRADSNEEEAEGEEAAQRDGAGNAKQGAAAAAGSGDQLSAFEVALHRCVANASLACVKEAHTQPKLPGQYNFPHFYILGFPKCVTTSLFHHLIQHPTIMAPRIKEPNFYTSRCQDNALTCSLHEQQKYINRTLHIELALQVRLHMAVFEGSTHYSLAGEWLAPQLRELMPWVKLVLSMRDPISRAISMLQHNLDHSRRPVCYDADTGYIYACIKQQLAEESHRYAPRLRAWVENFPREQLHIVQYENLTGAGMKTALRGIKRFMDLDAKFPSDDLGLKNSRRQDHTQGWAMSRREYTHLVSMARKDAEEVVDLIRDHGFADAGKWMKTWEHAWQANLRLCKSGPDGLCRIQLT